MHLVRGYHISGRKAPQPVLRTILCIDIINDAMSQRSFVRTCRSTLAVRDMVAPYEVRCTEVRGKDAVIKRLRLEDAKLQTIHSTLHHNRIQKNGAVAKSLRYSPALLKRTYFLQNSFSIFKQLYLLIVRSKRHHFL